MHPTPWLWSTSQAHTQYNVIYLLWDPWFDHCTLCFKLVSGGYNSFSFSPRLFPWQWLQSFNTSSKLPLIVPISSMLIMGAILCSPLRWGPNWSLTWYLLFAPSLPEEKGKKMTGLFIFEDLTTSNLRRLIMTYCKFIMKCINDIQFKAHMTYI